MKKAVVILIKTNLLGILSLYNNGSWGMPGGKVEPLEKDKDAAVRELKEETGIIIPEFCLTPIYLAACGDYLTLTYKLHLDEAILLGLIKNVVTEPGVEHGFLSEYELSNPKISKYHEYNKKLFEMHKKLFA